MHDGPLAAGAGGADLPIGRLQDFYELPQVPTDAGPFRVQQMLRLLSLVLDDAERPLRIVDVGCGDGEATEQIDGLARSRTAGHTATTTADTTASGTSTTTA